MSVSGIYRSLIHCLFLACAFFIFISPAHANSLSTLAVAYFDNGSGQKEFDPLSKGLADMLITDLAKLSSLRVVEREKLELLLKEIKLNKGVYFDKSTAQQLGKGLGARYLLTGSFFLLGKELRIDARLLRVESGEVLMAESVSGAKTDVFSMEKRLVDNIIAGLKIKPKPAEKNALQALDTQSFDAFEQYSAGLDSLDSKNYSQAQQQLKAAIELDAGFAKARGALETAIAALQKDVAQVKRQTQAIDERTGKIELSLSEIAKGFASIAKSGALIASPQQPQEFYFNAMIYQERGEIGNARLSYQSYLSFRKEFIDPLDRFSRLLVTMEGSRGAAELLRAANAQYAALPIQVVLATLKEPRLAAQALIALVKSNPGYGPIYYLIAEQYSEVRLGDRSIDDQLNERAFLKQFLDAHAKGQVLPYFIDQRIATEWLEKAQARYQQGARLEKLSKESLVFEVSRSNIDWSVNVSIAEPVTQILYRIGKSGPLRDNGYTDVLDSRIGGREPDSQIRLTDGDDLKAFELYYVDVSGTRRGPFTLPAEMATPTGALAVHNKKILEMTKGAWLALMKGVGAPNLYFTHLISYRCGIKTVRYGFGATLDRTFGLPACDPDNPYNALGTIYLPTDAGVKSVSVQLVYFDGTQSEVQKFSLR